MLNDRIMRWLLLAAALFLIVGLVACDGDDDVIGDDDNVGLTDEDSALEDEIEEEFTEEETVVVPEEDMALTPFGVATSQGEITMLAEQMLDSEVENPLEEQLGEVEDIIFDRSSGNVLFVLIESGGFLDIGDDTVIVPLSALALGPENDELILDVSEEVFEDYPDIDLDDDWPLNPDETWDDEIAAFWADSGYDVTILDGVDPTMVSRASNLLDIDLGTFDLDGIGNVDDLAVDLGTSQITYAIVSFIDTDLYGDEWIAIPWESFDPAAFTTELQFIEGFNDELLIDAPRIAWPTLGDEALLDPTWDDEFASFWTDVTMIDETAVNDIDEEIVEEAEEMMTLGMTDNDDMMVLADALLGREVKNAFEEQLGSVEDVVFDRETGNVLFALIEHGGFLDIGDEEAAVPLTALSLGPENDELILNVSEEVFENYPDIDLELAWPNIDDNVILDETWDDEITAFWNDEGFDVTLLDGVNPTMVARLSNLIGLDIMTNDLVDLADVESVIVDLGEGQIAYAVMTFNDTSFYGIEPGIVPWETFDPSVFDQALSLDPNLDLTLLQDAPRFEPEEMGLADESFLDPTWDDEIELYWQDVING